jgi:hypothetical protein
MKSFLTLAVLALLAVAAPADMGPKPTMDLHLQQGMPVKVSIVSAILFESKDATGKGATEFRQMGPQRLEVKPDSLFAMAYGFAPYHCLKVTFSDGKTRKSNVFPTAGFRSRYLMTVREKDLLIQPVK